MTGKTHRSAGLTIAAAYLVIAAPRIEMLPVVLITGYFAALLPDWWQFSSPDVTVPCVEGHRGASHTLGVVLIMLGLWLWVDAPQWLWLPFELAYISHLLLDAVTVRGVPLFWPIGCRQISLGLTSNGSWLDHTTGQSLLVVAGLLIVVYLARLVT